MKKINGIYMWEYTGWMKYRNVEKNYLKIAQCPEVDRTIVYRVSYFDFTYSAEYVWPNLNNHTLGWRIVMGRSQNFFIIDDIDKNSPHYR